MSELFANEILTKELRYGLPEGHVQETLSRLSLVYKTKMADEILLVYPRFSNIIRKLEKIYLNRFNNLGIDELTFFLETYPDFLSSYIVTVIPKTVKEGNVCPEWQALGKDAKANFIQNFPYRAKRIMQRCE
ncbi:hypothetical protein NECAME_10467 [Necator americanus]|uniref:Uncharacterized protein n=1 Tax=Necator americanus TaxID=51031 RepID=W2T8F5_NECAM|nr:hypothetical protein NECAME_10467 [Necator americanus]ETN78270.1 hypothetical protein NECAME_10467 [Necator americanus]